MRAWRNIGILVASLVAVGGCFRSGGSPMGVALKSRTQFESEWRGYQRLTGMKALAVAGDLQGVYVSGFAWAYPVQKPANREALENCEERRADRRVEPECRLYAVGDERLGAAEGD
jgi:hypothetical protein